MSEKGICTVPSLDALQVCPISSHSYTVTLYSDYCYGAGE